MARPRLSHVLALVSTSIILTVVLPVVADPGQHPELATREQRQAAERRSEDLRAKAARAHSKMSVRRRANKNGRFNEHIPAPEYVDRVSEAGQAATGFYVTGAFAQIRGARGLIESVRRAQLTAAVIDMKDSAGRVTYDTQIEILNASEVRYIRDMAGLVRRLKEAGIYTIARIACFADPKLAARHPERAIIHSARGTPWKSWGTGGYWLDPYNRDNHTLVVELAKEAHRFGFDEVQFDYIRWPVDAGIRWALYPAETDEPRPLVLAEMLRRVDEAIPIPISVDVFGLTAFDRGQVEVLGQYDYLWTSHVEVFSPMIYLHAMRNWNRGTANRNQVLIQIGIEQMRERLGPIPIIRPFIQSFDRGNSGAFEPRFIADQIRGARLGGADGFLFWHPGSRYSMLTAGMNGPARGLSPFPLDPRPNLRAQYWDRIASGQQPAVAQADRRAKRR